MPCNGRMPADQRAQTCTNCESCALYCKNALLLPVAPRETRCRRLPAELLESRTGARGSTSSRNFAQKSAVKRPVKTHWQGIPHPEDLPELCKHTCSQAPGLKWAC